MIELKIFDYLVGALTVPVYMEIPESPPDSFVVLEKTGSSRANFVETATLAIQSYGLSMYDAASLNELVKDAMTDMGKLIDFGKVELNSDYNFTNTQTKKYRYQAVYAVTYVE